MAVEQTNLESILGHVKHRHDFNSVIHHYNVVWDSQSKDSSESMPVGGGDIGLNVWVEDNALYFYIGKSDAFDENNMLAKLGRVKVTLTPNPFEEGTSFKQELKLHEGYCMISGTGKDGQEVVIKVWVDVLTSTIHVEVESEEDVTVTAEYQSWRYEDRLVKQITGLDQYIDFTWDYPETLIEHADRIGFEDNGILFYHKNDNSDLAMDKAISQIGLDEEELETWFDPQTDFVFGGLMNGEGMIATGIGGGSYNKTGDRGDYKAWVIKSAKPAQKQSLTIKVHTGQFENIWEWRKALEDKREGKHQESIQWWHDFWERSHVVVNPDKDQKDEGWQAAKNYALFRYMEGCNAFGKYPLKFNGGIFTWDHEGNPDYRRWGGSTMTAQNQRHLYWPLLKSGDFELMIPQFDFYNHTYKNNEQATKQFWGHEGTHFNEYPSHYGLNATAFYGWTENYRKGLEDGVIYEPYTRHEYVHQLDFAKMILDYHIYSGNDIGEYIGFIESSARFFLEHYKYEYKKYNPKSLDGFDKQGKLVIYPSTAAETYKNVLNPTDVIYALQSVCEGLLELEKEGYQIESARWRELLTRLPQINIEGSEEETQVFKPGYHPGQMGLENQEYQKAEYYYFNIEIPQLSVVYPYNKVSLGQDLVDTGIRTWQTELDDNQKGHVSWHYGNIITARLGLVEEAKTLTVKKLADSGRRFSAFFGPGHDWTPDHNWGGTGMMGLQEMALQAFGETILPYPCWPSDWSGQFKLQAPYDTTVEACIHKGELEWISFAVHSKSRREKIMLCYPEVSENWYIYQANGDSIAMQVINQNKVAFEVTAETTYFATKK